MAGSSAACERLVCPEVAEPPGATWSNGIRIGQELVLSGMTAHPASREGTLDTYAQTRVVLEKIRALLVAGGGGVHNLYKLVVYVTDIADKEAVGRARRDFFAGFAACPCSTLVQVSALVFPELRVEIDGYARLDFDLNALAARP